MEKCFVHTNGTDLCRAKQLMGGRRKMDVCCVVSCHGGQLKAHCKAGANSHPLLIPQFLSSRLQPSIPSLIFISASVMRTKKSTHSLAPRPLPSLPQPPIPCFPPSIPPLFFARSLQARLAGLISNCDLTTWWKDWHAQTSAHEARRTGTRIDASAHMWLGGQGPVLLGSNYPPSQATREKMGGGRQRGRFAFSNVTHRLQRTPPHTKKESMCLVLVTIFFSFFCFPEPTC